MKRLVVLIDGTWNDERRSDLTNVAKLDPALRPIIRRRGSDGTAQVVFYHDGVGARGSLLERILGGAIGLGLKRIVQDAYGFLAEKFTAGDEVYILETWFAGVHCSVGGGYADAGLSDRALIWMIARMMVLTGLEFARAAAKAILKPKIDGEVRDSSIGWPISRLFPHTRVVLAPDAIHHGIFFNTRRPQEEHINERMHWSVLEKHARPCNYFGVPDTPYLPHNLPQAIPRDRVAEVAPEERMLTEGS
jgi:hypothetical protein